jgi:hypothetical protein
LQHKHLVSYNTLLTNTQLKAPGGLALQGRQASFHFDGLQSPTKSIRPHSWTQGVCDETGEEAIETEEDKQTTHEDNGDERDVNAMSMCDSTSVTEQFVDAKEEL